MKCFYRLIKFFITTGFILLCCFSLLLISTFVIGQATNRGGKGLLARVFTDMQREVPNFKAAPEIESYKITTVNDVTFRENFDKEQVDEKIKLDNRLESSDESLNPPKDADYEEKTSTIGNGSQNGERNFHILLTWENTRPGGEFGFYLNGNFWLKTSNGPIQYEVPKNRFWVFIESSDQNKPRGYRLPPEAKEIFILNYQESARLARKILSVQTTNEIFKFQALFVKGDYHIQPLKD